MEYHPISNVRFVIATLNSDYLNNNSHPVLLIAMTSSPGEPLPFLPHPLTVSSLLITKATHLMVLVTTTVHL